MTTNNRLAGRSTDRADARKSLRATWRTRSGPAFPSSDAVNGGPLDASQPVRIHNTRPVTTPDSPCIGTDLGDDLPCNPAALIHVDFDRTACRMTAVILPVRIILRAIVEALVTPVTKVRLPLDEGDVHSATQRAESTGKLCHDRREVVLAGRVIGGLLGQGGVRRLG